ncbi:unnamed protein product [Symbiodinium sp. CCMP2592]|nr:unnamed protein product [Symbiodinium sp. CCMP2592]
MKQDGDQLATAGPEHSTPLQVGKSDRCMELHVMHRVAAGSNQNLFEATASLENMRCVSARAFLFPAVNVFCWWRRRPHSGLLGIRIGEAANPGPGAASATANRRREHMTQEALQTIIQLLVAMVAVLAGDNPAIKSQLAGIRNLMTNMSGGFADEVGPPARRVSFDDTAGQSDNDGFQTVSRRRARKNQSPPEPEATKGGGKTKSFAAVVGTGLSSGKGKGKGTPQPPKGQGKAAKAPSGAPARPQLRDRDGNGGVPAQQLEWLSVGTCPRRGTDRCIDDDAHWCRRQVLSKIGLADPDGKLKLPVESKDGKDVRILHFACVDFLTPGTPLPTLKNAPAAAKAVPAGEATTTLRTVFGKLFLEESDWTRASSAPKAAVQRWVRGTLKAELHGAVKDAWGFAQETRLRTPAVVGLIRVPVKVVETLLGSSGDGGVFLEPAGQEHNVNCMIEWVGAQETESWPAAFKRALEAARRFGAFLGERQIGLRTEAGTSPVQGFVRYFTMQGTPVEWSDGVVAELVKEQITLTASRRKGRAHWMIKAKVSHADADAFQIFVKEGNTEAPPSQHCNKPEQKPGAESSAEPPSKKQAVAEKLRGLPAKVTLQRVDGDGNCFYTVIGRAVGRLRNEPALAPHRVGAEICAHMRKHQSSYETYWSGQDSTGNELESFAEYIDHMADAGRWAGSLEAYGAAKTYKVAVHIIPAPLRLAKAAYNTSASDRIALWFTEKPGHFDWLCPVEGNDFPEDLCTGHAEGHVTDLPRGGGPQAASRDNDFVKTVFTVAAVVEQAEAASTVFTRVSRMTQSGGEAGATATGSCAASRAASEAANSKANQSKFDDNGDEEATVFTDAVRAAPKDIRELFKAGRRAGSGAVSVYTEGDLDFDCDLPAEVSGGQVKYWVQKKQRHIDNFHPAAGWASLPQRLIRMRVFGLANTMATPTTRLKLAAGVAKRLHQLKAGKAADHDVTFVKLPPTLSGGETSRGKQRKQRNFCTRALCKRCKRLAQSVAELGSKPCKTHSAGAKRPAFIARLTAALQAGGLDDLVTRDVEYLLELFAEDTTDTNTEHDLTATAWSLGGHDFVVRFVCSGCGGVWKRLRDAEGKQCQPAKRRAILGKVKELNAVIDEGGTPAKAAKLILGIMGEKGGASSDKIDLELARGEGKMGSVMDLAANAGVDVLCLQETKLTEEGPLAFDCEGKACGGVAFVSDWPVELVAAPSDQNGYLPANDAELNKHIASTVLRWAVTTGEDFVFLADWNRTPHQQPLCNLVASGVVYAMDPDPFTEGKGTHRLEDGTYTGRLLDFGLSSARLAVSGRAQQLGPADHDLVTYDVHRHSGLRGWRWQAQQRLALDKETWTGSYTGCSFRQASWSIGQALPGPYLAEAHFGKTASVQTLRESSSNPTSDENAGEAKLNRYLQHLADVYPDLAEVVRLQGPALLTFLQEKAAEEEKRANCARLDKWAQDVQTDLPRLARWVKTSCAEKNTSFENFAVDPDPQAKAEAAAAEWTLVEPSQAARRRGPSPTLDRAAAGQGWARPGSAPPLRLEGHALLRRARATAKKVRICLIPKQDGGLRPLAIAALAWVLGAACLVQLLGDWIRRVFPAALYGGMPGRSVDDVHANLTHDLYVQRVGGPLAGCKADVRKCFDSASPLLAVDCLRALGAIAG